MPSGFNRGAVWPVECFSVAPVGSSEDVPWTVGRVSLVSTARQRAAWALWKSPCPVVPRGRQPAGQLGVGVLVSGDPSELRGPGGCVAGHPLQESARVCVFRADGAPRSPTAPSRAENRAFAPYAF